MESTVAYMHEVVKKCRRKPYIYTMGYNKLKILLDTFPYLKLVVRTSYYYYFLFSTVVSFFKTKVATFKKTYPISTIFIS